jgi:hypothetical protein
VNADLPYHIVVGMPALSPTMETGVLAEWYLSEGSSFIAGEAIAKIETDKASIDFEAQDDGFVGTYHFTPVTNHLTTRFWRKSLLRCHPHQYFPIIVNLLPFHHPCGRMHIHNNTSS